MSSWIPKLAGTANPRYLAIVDALEADIVAGRVRPGARLLPHRDMANRLGLSVGTISKAYAEAERRGLISGEVGRGTFVLRLAVSRGSDKRRGPMVNLALNVPPPTGADEAIAATLAEISADGDVGALLDYLPHSGRRDHREAVAGWLSAQDVETTTDNLILTSGAQHAISIAISLLAAPGDVVLTERLTYSGITALSEHTGYRLHGVEMDAEGLLPEALDQAFAATGARVLYAMPTLQTPTAAVMSEARRQQIAEIIRRRDAYLVEDDAYGFLMPEPLQPVSRRIPERSFYVLSFAKCLAPGLRIGAMIVPPRFRDRAANAMRATGWMAVPMMAEVVRRLIDNGGLARQVKEKRRQAAARYDIARRVLGSHLQLDASHPCFHVWMRSPPGRPIASLIAQAAGAGITLAAPSVVAPDAAESGVRLCLGGAHTEAELEWVLGQLRDILERNEELSVV